MSQTQETPKEEASSDISLAAEGTDNNGHTGTDIGAGTDAVAVAAVATQYHSMTHLEGSRLADAYADSKIGGRDENQDSCCYAEVPLGSLYIVCDGMGGMNGGSTASRMAVDVILKRMLLTPENSDPFGTIRRAVRAANEAIISKGNSDPALRGMGTTLTLALLTKKAAYVTHLGDSRIYQLRDGKKVFRTFDHSVVFGLVKSGAITEEQARTAGNSNVITKALGVFESIDAEVIALPYRKGDRFILCTDGFWGAMPEPDMLKLVCARGPLDLMLKRSFIAVEDKARENKNGHHDNLTAIVFDVKQHSELISKMERRILYSVIAALFVALAASVCVNVSQHNKLKDATAASEKHETTAALEKHETTATLEKHETTATLEKQDSTVAPKKQETVAAPAKEVAGLAKVEKITKEELQAILNKRNYNKDDETLHSRMLSNCRFIVSNVKMLKGDDGKDKPAVPHPTSLTEIINRLESGEYNCVVIMSVSHDEDTDKLRQVTLKVYPRKEEKENYK